MVSHDRVIEISKKDIEGWVISNLRVSPYIFFTWGVGIFIIVLPEPWLERIQWVYLNPSIFEVYVQIDIM